MIKLKYLLGFSFVLPITVTAWGQLIVIPQSTSYTNDVNTVLLEHFDGSTSGSVYGSANYANSLYGQCLSIDDTSFISWNNEGFLPQGTVEFWANLTKQKTQGELFFAFNPQYANWGCFSIGTTVLTNGTTVPWAQYYNCCGWTGMSGNDPNSLNLPIIAPNTWHHYAVTWGGAGYHFYFDGKLIFQNSSTDGPYSTSYWQVGNNSNVGNDAQGFTGLMDELRISNIQRIFTNAPPETITQDLTNNTAVFGQNATLTFQATNASSPVSYQWYWVPSNNLGQQAGAYAQTIVGFVYGAVVTNGGWGYGNTPYVSFIGGGGSGASGYGIVSNGVVTGISVTNAGSGYTSLPAVVIDAPNGLLYGQTNSGYTITNASANSLGTYFCVASSGSGSVTSSVANLTLLYPPGIAINPIGYTGTYQSSNSLSVTASGTPPFTYQWQLNGTNLVSGTNSSLSIPSLNLNSAGAYNAIVSSPYGSVTSSVANVYLAPTLTAPFGGAVVLWGQNTTLGVGAIGSGALSYQWYFNGQPISGANSSSYSFGGIQFTNAGLYSVVVSSAYGSTTNATYQVVVNPANVDIGFYPAVGISGTIGYTYTVQSSTNLGDINAWVNETNVILSAPYQKWSDYSGMGKGKFYRVVPGQ
jgi:Concanavalin A-like lectin/glucanases superfamily